MAGKKKDDDVKVPEPQVPSDDIIKAEPPLTA